MSVPLDRLYHYIENISREVGVDSIIYRFFPHGQKNIANLNMLKSYEHVSWVDHHITPPMICHDQEPLNYDLYRQNNIQDYVIKKYNNDTIKKRWLIDQVSKSNLRSAIKFPACAFDHALLVHSERNSQELEHYESNNFIGVYWWAHAVIARDWFRFAEHDSTLDHKHVAKDFLIYNRAWSGTREYRLKFTEMLADHGMINSCDIKFQATDNDVHYTRHRFRNTNFQIFRDDLEKIYPKNFSSAEYSADYVSQEYCQTAIEVVLETMFDDQRHHLTEKTLRPIACGQPFILVSTPGSLQYLKSYGFQTFDGLIDETYDTIKNPVERLHFIIKEMQRISKLDRQQKQVLWQQCQQIAKANKTLFFSKTWHDKMVNEFKTNLIAAAKKLDQYPVGTWMKKVKQAALDDPYMAEILNSSYPWRSLDDQKKLFKWIENVNKEKYLTTQSTNK